DSLGAAMSSAVVAVIASLAAAVRGDAWHLDLSILHRSTSSACGKPQSLSIKYKHNLIKHLI
ncbi:MAG: hypothetical protein Q8M64_02825, partial [Methyloversatilis sp.]|nr:hypothetical protein [Methyloversatilis sp.]